MKIQLLVFLAVQSVVLCAFFDPTEVDDPLSLFWYSVHKDFALPQNNAPCIVPLAGGFSVVSGECKHKTLCLLSGGQTHSHRNCGSFMSCCTPSTICSRRTKAKVSHFISDNVNAIKDCEYVVEAQNENVCQMRIDFEEFNLSPSEQLATDKGKHSVCSKDYMTISPDPHNVPKFCGNNDGQHVYIHLRSHREVKLQIRVVNRTGTNLLLPSAKWKIKVTQLECPTKEHFFSKHKSTAFEDFPLLAPDRALQYFLAPNGRIRSFGFNGGQGDYISNLHYSITFKSAPHHNCIRFTNNYLVLRHFHNEPSSEIQNNTEKFCWDYLLIPDFQEISGAIPRFGSRLCSGFNKPQEFYLNSPAPLQIFFRSQSYYTDDYNELPQLVRAFDLQYELVNCN